MAIEATKLVESGSIHMRVFCTFQVEGLHQCPVDIATVAGESYLANLHRHMFHFKVSIETDPLEDRDIEFISFRRECMGYAANMLRPGREFKSCEQLAIGMVRWLVWANRGDKAITVEVSEDGENGAVASYKPSHSGR